MTIKLQFNSIFAYSDSEKKYFYYDFNSGTNVIGGENTSGKSSLLQMLLYACGINDVKDSLSEILEYKPIVRLDCELFKAHENHNILFIRDGDEFYVKYQNKISRFFGINADNALEHIRLKGYISELLGVSLVLESNGELKSAPIEAIFMPYYIPQSVGWFSIRKSFGGFEYYKNFKEDYLDYYVGVENGIDREKKAKLNKQLSLMSLSFDSIKEIRYSDDDIQTSMFIDENSLLSKSEDYLIDYRENLTKLISLEKENIRLNNELSYYRVRKSILHRVNQNLLNQDPKKDTCPVCKQHLIFTFSDNYKYHQNLNNTYSEFTSCKTKLKEISAKIDANIRTIKKLKNNIDSQSKIFNATKIDSVSLSTWLDAKIYSSIGDKISDKLLKIQNNILRIKDDLKKYKTSDDLVHDRQEYIKRFKRQLAENLNALEVQLPVEERYLDLYKISALPYQGVELLKAILAYNFAFNKIIAQNNSIHRLPFILDAVFKEDFTGNNEELVCKFIAENKPNDTQLFVSMAGDKASKFVKDYLKGNATLIIIGNQGQSRCLFKKYNGEYEQILQEINDITNSI